MLRITLFRLFVVLFVVFVFNTTDSSARTDILLPTVEWIRQFNATDTAGSEQVTGISGENELYVVGYTEHALPGQTDLDTPIKTDAFIRKYDIHGNELWTRQFGSVGDDASVGVAANASGAFVVGTVTNWENGEFPMAFVYRFDADGNILWMQKFGSATGSYATDVVIAEASIYVTGTTFDALPGQTAEGLVDAYVRKYDFNGNEIWTRQFGTPGSDQAGQIATDGSHVYVAGYTTGNMADQISAGNEDAFVTKFDSSGNQLWVRQFGTSADDEGRDIAVTGADLFVVGRTSGTLPGQTSMGESDSFIRRYDANGNEVWTRQFGTPFNDGAFEVALNNGRVHITGSGLYSADAQINFDLYVHTLDIDGNQLWAQQFGSTGYDEANAIHVIGSDVYVAGTTRGALPGQLDLNNAGAFVRKYTADGTEVWTQQFGAIKQSDSGAWEQHITIHDGVYAAGFTDAAFPGQPFFGQRDGFVLKYSEEGQSEWVRQIGSERGDAISGIAVDGSGLYVGYNSGDFNPAGNVGYLRKYDSAGVEVWVRTYGISVAGVAVNGSGLYVVGNRDQQSGVHLSRFDKDGNEISSQQLPNTDFASILWQDDSGVYVLGNPSNDGRYIGKYRTDGTNAWTVPLNQTFLGCFYTLATVGPAGLFVFGSDCIRRYNLDGNLIWSGDALWPSVSQYMVATDSSYIYQAWTDHQINVRKFDLEGTEVWTHSFAIEGTSHDLAALAVDDNHIYLLGRVSGIIGSGIPSRPFLAKITKEAIDYTEFLYLPVVDGN